MQRSREAPLRERRRSEIVAVARQIVAEEGLDALTIGAVESRVDFTRGVITYHFRGKDDIVRAVLQSAVDEVNLAARTAAAGSDPDSRVAAVLRALVHGFLSRPESTRILLSFWGRIGADADVRRTNAALFSAWRKDAATLLQDGIRAGRWRDVHVDAMSAHLVGIVIGVVSMALFDPRNIDADSVLGEAIASVEARLARGA